MEPTETDGEQPNFRNLMLIGCSKTKHEVAFNQKTGGRVTPQKLYAGQLFSKRVEYATRNRLRWYVLSAKYGVWRPNIELKPYDRTFSDMNTAEVAAWHIGVARHLVEELWEGFNQNVTDGPLKPSELTIEIHAGADYAHPLAELLEALGIKVDLPLKGLGIGEQLAWYCNQTASKKANSNVA